MGWRQTEHTEYGRAIQLLEAFEDYKRAWMQMHPPPPVKKGDMRLVQALLDIECRGELVTAGQLAARLHHSAPAITQKLNALEDAGMVCRVADKNDRRVAYVELTDKGKKTAQKATKELLGGLEAALDELGDEKAGQLAGLVEELSEVMKKMEKNGEPAGAEAACPAEGMETLC